MYKQLCDILGTVTTQMMRLPRSNQAQRQDNWHNDHDIIYIYIISSSHLSHVMHGHVITFKQTSDTPISLKNHWHLLTLDNKSSLSEHANRVYLKSSRRSRFVLEASGRSSNLTFSSGMTRPPVEKQVLAAATPNPPPSFFLPKRRRGAVNGCF